MKIDLTCPVEAWRVVLPEGTRKVADVTLFNLSDMQVSSVEMQLRLLDEAGGEVSLITHRGRMLDGVPGRTFRMVMPVENTADAAGYEAFITRVWFDNGAVWRHEAQNLTEYTPNNLHRSPQLSQLRAIAGISASGYPVRQDGLWLCVCGRPNREEMSTCMRCHQDRDTVFQRFSRDAIEEAAQARERELDEIRRRALEGSSASQDDDDDEDDYVHRRQPKKKKGWLLGAGIAVALLGGAGVLAYHGLPALQ